MTIDLNKKYRVSEDIIAREIEGELVIVPLKSGLGDLNAEMFGLSATGISIWRKLDGSHSLYEIIQALLAEYDAIREEVEADVLELMETLLKKGLVIEP